VFLNVEELIRIKGKLPLYMMVILVWAKEGSNWGACGTVSSITALHVAFSYTPFTCLPSTRDSELSFAYESGPALSGGYILGALLTHYQVVSSLPEVAWW
jgi:hypothetical protein